MKSEQFAFALGYRVDRKGRALGLKKKFLKGMLQSGYWKFTAGSAYGPTVFVHRLVAYQKYGELLYSTGLEVRHLDGNSTNNRYKNIVLGTRSQNQMDKPRALRVRVASAAARVLRKLSEKEAGQLRADRKCGMRYSDLQFKYKLAKSTVSYVVNNKTYKGGSK